MMALFETPKMIAYALVAVAVTLLVGGAGLGLYKWGYGKAEAAWTQKYQDLQDDIASAREAEVKRQVEANTEAKRREALKIQQLLSEKEAMEKLIGELEDEASRDPDGSRECLSDGSRLRIDRIR